MVLRRRVRILKSVIVMRTIIKILLRLITTIVIGWASHRASGRGTQWNHWRHHGRHRRRHYRWHSWQGGF